MLPLVVAALIYQLVDKLVDLRALREEAPPHLSPSRDMPEPRPLQQQAVGDREHPF
jgi:hypothetical protein